MSAGNWIKIEAGNRNQSELRSTIDQFTSAYARLQHIVDKMSQMSSGGAEYTGLEAEYGLEAGEGTTVESLVASAKGELDAAPFFQQMTERLG